MARRQPPYEFSLTPLPPERTHEHTHTHTGGPEKELSFNLAAALSILSRRNLSFDKLRDRISSDFLPKRQYRLYTGFRRVPDPLPGSARFRLVFITIFDIIKRRIGNCPRRYQVRAMGGGARGGTRPGQFSREHEIRTYAIHSYTRIILRGIIILVVVVLLLFRDLWSTAEEVICGEDGSNRGFELNRVLLLDT